MLSFIKNRPPLVIFILCLIITSLTLFFFAFYIKNTDVIPDSDSKYDWNQLLRYLKDLDICITNHNEKIAENNNFLRELTTVETLVHINLLGLQNYSEIRGILTLDGWHATCTRNTPEPHSLEIFFELPKVGENLSNGNICVSLRGPSEYLPTFSEPNCVVEGTRKEKTKRVGFLMSSKREKKQDFCQNGITSKIGFLPQTKNTIISSLGKNEKSLIFVHLLWTGFILIFVILAIVIHNVFQSDSRLDKYVEKCTSLLNNR